MESVYIHNTSMQTSRLGFGTASLHRLPYSSKRQALLAAAFDTGFTHFDTARMYGEGIAERELGYFFAGGLRQKVTIASKFGLPADPWFEYFPSLMYAQRALGMLARRTGYDGNHQRLRALSPKAADISLFKTLNALKTDWLDILFVHEPLLCDVAELHALAEWFLQQKTTGRVRYLGLAGSAVNCLAVMQQVPGVFDVLQVEDSLVGKEADIIVGANWPLQITYGYLRRAVEQAAKSATSPIDTLAVVRAGMARAVNSMVLVSTLKTSRLRDLASLAENEHIT